MSQAVQAAINLIKQGKAGEAERSLLLGLDENPENYEVLEMLAVLQADQGRWDEAVSAVRVNIKHQQPDAKKYQLLGTLLGALGDEEAEQAYKMAIDTDPLVAGAYLELSHLDTVTEPVALCKEIERKIEEAGVSGQLASTLHFSAGNLQRKAGEHEQAFSHYDQANTLAHKPFSVDEFNRSLAALKQVFTKDFFSARKKQGFDTSAPLFLIGMPQSGAPVLERMLVNHSQIATVGERADMMLLSELLGKINRVSAGYPSSAKAVTAAQAQMLGKTYLDKIRGQAGCKKVSAIIDNSTLNFLHVGLITLLLPQAKFVYLRRHPLNNCLSCYFQPYSEVHGVSYSLESLGEFYVGLTDLMAHWQEVLPGKILEVDYEKLIASPSKQLKQVLSFCGLEWESSCVDAGMDTRPTSINASLWQVRRTKYHSYDLNWQDYATFIEPLQARLSAYLSK